MKSLFPVVILSVLTLVAPSAIGQASHMKHPILGEVTTKISDHVYEITGFPNIAIVVGQ